LVGPVRWHNFLYCLDCGTIRRICGARRLSKNVTAELPWHYCQHDPLVGKLRCRQHGRRRDRRRDRPPGKRCSPSSEPLYTLSEALPENMGRRFQSILRDPELLSSRTELALMRLRELEVAERFSTGESGSAWAELQAAYAEIQTAFAAKDVEALGKGLSRVGKAIRSGNRREKTWRDMVGMAGIKAKLAETEIRSLQALQQIVTGEQIQLLTAALVLAVRKNVTDHQVVEAIGAELLVILRQHGVAMGGLSMQAAQCRDGAVVGLSERPAITAEVVCACEMAPEPEAAEVAAGAAPQAEPEPSGPATGPQETGPAPGGP